jgi:MoxR-like ATPase
MFNEAPEARWAVTRADGSAARSPFAAVEQAVHDNSAWVGRLRSELGHVVVGQRQLVDRLLVALLTGGHVLVEGLPGLAKTLSLKTLAGAIDARFRRIQFTPDMLPADVVGTLVYVPHEGRFETKHGPIFANLVLADEINRAPAKVQSALLEAMQEGQVTLGAASFALPRPFLVRATQNPVEQEGTYALPEAQIDRFLMKVVVDYPDAREERQILDAMATTQPRLDVAHVTTLDQILQARSVVDTVHVDDRVRDYIERLVRATRRPSGAGVPMDRHVRYGASPRATIALTLSAKAWAFLQQRAYVTPQDVKAMAMDVLRHRVAPSYEGEARGSTSEKIVSAVLEAVAVP